MKSICLLFLSQFITVIAVFGQRSYDSALIADSLKKDANVVVRQYSTTYHCSSPAKVSKEVHIAITVLNPNGKYLSELAIYYDRNTHVSAIKASIYAKDGDLQRKVKKSEIRDLAAHVGYTLFSDSRVKYFKPAVNTYPFTIEYNYRVDYDGMVAFESWIPQLSFGCAVEHAELQLVLNKDFEVSTKELNHPFTIVESSVDGFVSKKWTTKNIKAIQYEPFLPNYLDIFAAVLLTPKRIAYEGTKGDFSNWKSYGKWIYSLLENRDVLDAKTIRHIHSITDSLVDKRQKAEAVYKYMQGRTRYVNIALGIGGFQPLRASDVDEKGYGDCKALSNYTKTLLKHAGVEAFYTEIGSGSYTEIKFPDFASTNQTNHIVLSVPLENDTLWLECTNQKIPFGYLPEANQRRYALMIKADGGTLVKTPAFKAVDNSRDSKIKLKINEDGSAAFRLTTTFRNGSYENISALLKLSQKEQKDILLKEFFKLKNYKIQSFSLVKTSDIQASATMNVNGSIPNFANLRDNMLLFTADYFWPNDFPQSIRENRNTPVYIPLGYSCSDTLEISYPITFEMNTNTAGSEYESVYGTSSFQFKEKDDVIQILRHLTINEGLYKSENFDAINQFLRNIGSSEKKLVVLTKRR